MDLPRPPRVGKQGAAHCHQVKIAAVETPEEFIERAGV